MALPIKKPQTQPEAAAPAAQAAPVPAPAVNVAPALPGAPRRRGTGGLYPRLMATQVSEHMYQAIKEEVARRAAAGEPSDVASMGAIVREAVSKHLNVPV